MSASGSPANTKPESVRRFWSYRSSRCGSSGRSPQRCSSRDGGRGWKYHLLAGVTGVVIDGIVITAVVRVGFPILLQGWTGFGPMGVAMTLMTWCGENKQCCFFHLATLASRSASPIGSDYHRGEDITAGSSARQDAFRSRELSTEK